MTITQLDDIAKVHGYESMWMAAEAIRVSPVIAAGQISILADAISRYVAASAFGQYDLGETRQQVADAMADIHDGHDGLASQTIAHWRGPHGVAAPSATTDLRELLRTGIRRNIVLRRERRHSDRQFAVRTWTAIGDGWAVYVQDFEDKLPHRWQVRAVHWGGEKSGNSIELHRNFTPRMLAAAIAALDAR